MVESSGHSRRFIFMIILTVIGLMILSLRNFRLTPELGTGMVLLGFIALVFELKALQLPYFGFENVTFCLYFGAVVQLGLGAGTLVAAVSPLVRQIFMGKHDRVSRAVEYFSFLMNFMSAGLAYELLNGGAEFMSARNTAAIILGILIFYILDLLISTTAVGLLSNEFQKVWSRLKNRLRLFNLAMSPMTFFIPMAYSRDPFYVLMLVPPLAALRASLDYGIRDIMLAEQQDLENKLNAVQEEVVELRAEKRQVSEELQKKVDELSILYEMGQSLGASVSLENTMEIVISMVRRLVIYQSCVIFLLHKDRLVAARYVTPYSELLELSPLLQLEEGVISLVMSERKPVLIPDMVSIPEHRIFKDEKCVICVPLFVQNEIIGLMYVGITRAQAYNQNHLHLVTILANAASTAIKSAQLYETQKHALMLQQEMNQELDRKVKLLSALFDLGQALVKSLNMGETMRIIVEMTAKVVSYQSCIIFILEKGEFIPKQFVSPYDDYIKNISFSMDEGLLGWVASYQKPLLMEDTRDTRLPAVLEYERSAIILPLMAENEIFGILYIGTVEPGTYRTEDLALASTVAYQASMAIKNAELYQKMTTLAITDGLTGLYAHRYFQERLVEEIRWAERYSKHLSLLMLDTDHFKKYNDTLGHPEGDKLLLEIAALLRSYTRESDLVCRYGGDEFALVLRETGKEEAVKIAERIRHAFSLRFNRENLKITASIGVASFPEDARTKAELVAQADAALYRSKAGGRNKVTAAVQEISGSGENQEVHRAQENTGRLEI
jgi:diguanylate cyclase (GGDEF)-like protein